ncbi:MAG: iron-containing alcohol dehydrogenase [Clostridia bacterium]|nr:iron-containing alcohol dehydrogenase [Clostridia bacterium]
MKHFDVRTRINFGENALERLSELNYRRALFIVDPFIVRTGVIDKLTAYVDKTGMAWDVFHDVVPDPPLEKISVGVQKVLEYGPDVLIAVGGGSAIDSTKAIREVASKMDPSIQPALIAVPTTSGTGSEVTSFSVVSDRANRRKIPLVSDSLLPDEAILDVNMVTSVPPMVVADTGMDVFTHALEAYVSINRNEFSAALSEKSMELVMGYLMRSYLDNNDVEARDKMHVASCLAGLAFNSVSLGLNHGMAHQLGSNFHVPHGRANALLLPVIIEYNSGIDASTKAMDNYPLQVLQYADAARRLGLQCFDTVTSVRALAGWIRFMMKEMKMPMSVSETGKCTKEEYFAAIPDMAKAALADACTATNPRVPTYDEVVKLYENLW